MSLNDRSLMENLIFHEKSRRTRQRGKPVDRPAKTHEPGRKGRGYMRVKKFEPRPDPFLTLPVTRPGLLDP